MRPSFEELLIELDKANVKGTQLLQENSQQATLLRECREVVRYLLKKSCILENIEKVVSHTQLALSEEEFIMIKKVAALLPKLEGYKEGKEDVP